LFIKSYDTLKELIKQKEPSCCLALSKDLADEKEMAILCFEISKIRVFEIKRQIVRLILGNPFIIN